MSNTIGDELARLLAAMGLPPSADERDDLAAFVEAEIAASGLKATVTSIRWGRMTIEADPATVARLEFHRSRLEQLVTVRSDRTVTEIRLRSHGPARRPAHRQGGST